MYERNDGKSKMRTIQVSDPTYAAIWAAWREGDDGEEGVIRRLLSLKTEAPKSDGRKIGHVDKRSGVEFAEGFRIFRVREGKDRSAVAKDGGWMLDNNRWAPSLNQLSAYVGAPTENAWTGWFYMDGTTKKRIDSLRDESKVSRRS
jgi:hypothetical protein